MWDGDEGIFGNEGYIWKRSEPTVWDGDPYNAELLVDTKDKFRAHRVGWRLSIYYNSATFNNCSEPTVWDGDLLLLRSIRLIFLCSEPTVWDGDFNEVVKDQALRDVPSPPCGMATSSDLHPN